jgi:pimeloyl-ACP methyl ester carboxylesterase
MSRSSCPEFERTDPAVEEFSVTPNFVFLHGSWHRAKHFDPLRSRLEARGSNTEAYDWPTEQPDLDIDELARDIADRIQVPEMTDLWCASHAGNIGPRVAAILEDRLTPLAHLGYLNAGFEWTNDNYFGGEAKVPPKYTSADFFDNLRPCEHDPRLTIYNPDKVRDHFYNGCSEDYTEWAVDLLRPQYRRTEPLGPVPRWPSTPSTWIIGKQDKIISPDYSHYVAPVIGAQVIEVDAGHSGYISHPEEHAEIIHKNFGFVLKTMAYKSSRPGS